MSISKNNPYTKLTLVSMEWWDHVGRCYKTNSVFAELPADRDGKVRVSREWLTRNLNPPAVGTTFSIK